MILSLESDKFIRRLMEAYVMDNLKQYLRERIEQDQIFIKLKKVYKDDLFKAMRS